MTIHGSLTTRQVLSAARMWAAQRTPYFTASILSLVATEVPPGTLPSPKDKDGEPLGTLAVTDSGVLLYETRAIHRWKVPELGSVLIHEVMHWLRQHNTRCKARNADGVLWSLAADMEINDDLVRMKLPLPDGGGVTPAKFQFPDGRVAEEYYHLLRQLPQPPPPPQIGAGGCGSCAGHKLPGEPEGGTPVRSAQERAMIRVQAAEQVRAHAAKGKGDVPLGLQRWAEETVKPPKIPWSEKLAVAARGVAANVAGATDYTYAKISRRQAGFGFGPGKPVVPAVRGSRPRIALAIDTSGSMGESEGERALSEADAILRTANSDVTFLACDCAVHTVKEVRSVSQLRALLKGGGGTSFTPVFDHIAKTPALRPDLLVFITDGGGDAPAEAPKGYAVIWVLVGKHRCLPIGPNGHIDWGVMIEVDEDDA